LLQKKKKAKITDFSLYLNEKALKTGRGAQRKE
jgi:hypothetical protein